MNGKLISQPRKVTVQDLAEISVSLRMLLGAQIFERMLGGYDSTHAKGLADHVRRVGRAHPFAVAWDDLMKGAERSKREGMFRLSEQAFLLLDTLHSLSSVEKDPEFRNLLKRLAGRDQFFSTSFEAFIYYAYHSKGVPIALVPESTKIGERRPDLVSQPSDGAVVYLECKSLQDDVRAEERVWSEIEARIGKHLATSPLNLLLRMEASRRLTHADVQSVVDTASDMIRNYPLLRSGDLDGLRASIIELVPPGTVLPLPLNLQGSEDERTWVETEIDPETNLIRKLWAIEAKPFPDVEQSDRLVRLFRDAASQLPKDSPGVVHLQVPYRAAAHFLDVVDRARPQLERELKWRKHVCAIVVSGRFLNKRMAAEEIPVENSHIVIPNFETVHTLSPSFFILGSDEATDALAKVKDADLSRLPGGVFDVPSEGTFLIHFHINEPLKAQAGRYPFRYCSRDGRRQMSIWQTYRNLFRIEIVHEELGRRELTMDLNHLAVGVTHKMAFTWGEDGIRCAVNGEMVAS